MYNSDDALVEKKMLHGKILQGEIRVYGQKLKWHLCISLLFLFKENEYSIPKHFITIKHNDI